MHNIDEYSFGKMVVNGRVFKRDLIILPDKIVPDWWRKSGHLMVEDDIRIILEASPEALVVGTGAFGRMKIPADMKDVLQKSGLEMHSARSQEAVYLFNRLSAEKKTAGAFHLTC